MASCRSAAPQAEAQGAMRDQDKTRQQLLDELAELRRRLASAGKGALHAGAQPGPAGGSGDELARLGESLERRVAERTAAVEAQAHKLRRLVLELTHAEQGERQRIAGILHDQLQQLLAAAKLRATMVQARVPDEALRHQLEQVADLLDQASDASRSLSVELSPPILQYEGLLPTFEWLAENCQDKDGLLVSLDLDPAAEPEDETVRILLYQAARELLRNVVRHGRTNLAELQISRGADGQVTLSVADDGHGFCPDRLQAAGGRHTFGLFSIRERLAVLGGRMRIDSAPGTGTRVTITVADVPLAEAEAAAPPLVASAGGPAGVGASRAGAGAGTAGAPGRVEEPRARLRVLLADDHAVMRDGLATMLRVQPDIEVVGEASNGLEAVELALRLQPQVVIMDVSMPGLDGIQATRRIKSELPSLRVIGLSMHHEARVAEAMREAGAEAYFTKDSVSGNLLAALRT
ncbi:MAG: response regulator [Candidatus Latescibacterota bacterium]